MTDDQKQAVLDRDMNRMIALGGNIYFLAKIGATDGKSFQQMAASMTGMSRGRVPGHDDRRRPLAGRQPLHERVGSRAEHRMSARITASVYTSHVPAIGAAIDQGKTDEPYWQPLFAGYEPSKAWFARPHARRRSSSSTTTTPPRSASRSSRRSPSARRRRSPSPTRGGGRGRCRDVVGHPELGVAHRPLGHPAGLRPHDRQPAWTSITASPCRCRCMCGQPAAWPCPVIPFAVNVVHYPVPSGQRCLISARRSARRSSRTTTTSTCRSGAPAA